MVKGWNSLGNAGGVSASGLRDFGLRRVLRGRGEAAGFWAETGHRNRVLSYLYVLIYTLIWYVHLSLSLYIYVYKWASHLSHILSKSTGKHCNSACVRPLTSLFWMHCQSGETSGNAESGPDQIDVEVGFQKVEMIGGVAWEVPSPKVR